MAFNIILKNSSTPGQVPATYTIELGELALNTYDGKVYLKKEVDGVQTVVEVAGDALRSLSIANTNGFAGNSTGGINSIVTLSTTVSGIIKGNGTSLSAAIPGTDYLTPTAGTASWAYNLVGAGGISSSYASTASYAILSQNAFTANIATYAIDAENAVSSSRAISASYANVAAVALSAPSSVSSSYALNASNAVTASYILRAVSASFATLASQATLATRAIAAGTATSSLFSDVATTATSASYAITATTATSASFASIAASSTNTTSASYALNASNATSASFATRANASTLSTLAERAFASDTATTATTATQATSASLATNALTSSIATSASYALNASNALTASYILRAISSSYASQADNAIQANRAITAGTATSSLFADTTTTAISASYALNANNAVTASYVQTAQNALTASYILRAITSSYSLFSENSLNADRAITAGTATSSLFANTATTAISASYALNTSNATSASYALNASNTATASFAFQSINANVAITASYVERTNRASTASFAFYSNIANLAYDADSASYATNANNASLATRALTADLTDFALSASQANVAIYARNAANADNATAATTASYALTASYIEGGGGGGGGTPGGSNTQIQYNNGGYFAGVPVLTYDGATLKGTGSFTGSFSGSLFGTSSWAQSSSFTSFAISTSYASSSTSSSYASSSTSASYALFATSASYASSSTSASYAATASSADSFFIRNGITVTGSINQSGSFNINGTITATTLVVQEITSSRDFVTGSTRFGSNIATSTHQFTGSVSITGSLSIIGPTVASGSFTGSFSGSHTGSLFGTASWAQSASNVVGGATNYIPLWNSATTLSSSVIFQSTGSIGINTTTPISRSALDVSGLVALAGTTVNLDPGLAGGIGVNLSFMTSSAKVFIGWNRSGGDGEIDFISNRGPGGTIGGFKFYDYSSSLSELLTLRPGLAYFSSSSVGIGVLSPTANKLEIAGNVSASWYTGSLFGTSSWAQSASVAISSSNASFATSASQASTASYVISTGTNAFIQGGNSFGTTATLGTNDIYSLAVETNGVTRLFITSSEVISSIQYLGATSASNATSITLPLSGSSPFNGGLLENDLVIVASMHGSVSASVPTGYTSSVNALTSSMGYMWAYKFMGSTPDTTATNITGSTIAFAFRNVNRSVPFNVSSSASGSTGMPDPPSIFTTVNGSMIIALGFLDNDAGFAITAPSLYTLMGYTGSTLAANSGSIMGAYFQQAVSGTANPAAFGGTGTDTWVASTLTLNPITSSGNIGINNTNPLTALHVGTPVSGDFNLTNQAPVRISLPTFNTSASIIEALYIDHSHNDFTSGSGAAIVMGYKNPLYGSYTSRIINYTNTTKTTGTRLQLQTQTGLINNTWNTGILINEAGRVGINTTAPDSASLTVNGNIWATSITGSLSGSLTGSLFGTASWASNAISASYAQSSSFSVSASQAQSSSFSVSASYAQSSSFSVSASVVSNAFIQGGNSFGTTATLGTNDAQNLQFETNGTIRMIVSGSNGNVSIGTTTAPAFPLSIDSYKGIGIGGGSTYTSLGQTISGVMSILGHNVYVDTAANNTVKVTNSSWYPSMIKMYYDHGITFHTTGALQSANNTFFDNSTILNERMRINIDGNVGIGNTVPGARLVVQNSAGTNQPALGATGGHFQLQNGTYGLVAGVNTAGHTWIQSQTTSGTATAYNILMQVSGGAVGIGTTSPSALLHVSASGSTNDLLIGTNKLFVSASGVVGIGTTTPVSKLTVYDVNNLFPFTAGGSSATPNVVALGTVLSVPSINGYNYNFTTTTNLALQPQGGNLGIGTTTPSSSLHIINNNVQGIIIGSTTGSTGTIQIVGGPGVVVSPVAGRLIFGTTDNTGYQFRIAKNYTGSIIDLVTIQDNNGNVGIGTTSPSYKLDVSGSTRISWSLAVGNVTPSATKGRIDAENDVVAYSTSDINFKTNITPISDALEKITQIGGYEFDWKEEYKHHHGFSGHDVGVIAQEIKKVLPEIVTTRESGYKAVKYEKIVPLLIEAIKEQQKQIENLQQQINYLVDNKT